MKKLLVLLIVLGLATTAQAALSLSLSSSTVAIGSDVTVSVSDSVGENWTWQFVMSEDTYNWTDPVAVKYQPDRTKTGGVAVQVAAGNNADVSPDVTYAAVTQLTAAGTSPAPVAGVQFIVTLRGLQAGTVYIDLQDGGAGSQSTGAQTLVVIPEPMTIALLGLGGLFLRRRR